MPIIKLWERYFLWEFCKTCFFFIIGFYGLYILIDYSSRSGSFHHQHLQFRWLEIVTYYAFEFVKKSEVLIPFAILIATIRTLCSLNTHNELIALMSSGISLKMLMRPFLLAGLFFTCLMYLNTEFLQPIALKKLKRIEDSRSKAKRKENKTAAAQHIILEDNSTLIFQNYDTAQNRFFDTYWVRNIDEIYRIKYLYPYPEGVSEVPVGYFIDHLMRNPDGELIADASFKTKTFPEIHFNQKTLFETITLPEELAVSELWGKVPNKLDTINEKDSQAATELYRKLFLPWLCLLAVIGPAPFCLRYTRFLPVFFIYACSIFGLVAIYLTIDAAVLLGKRQIVSPFMALAPLSIAFTSYFGWKFLKIR
jgi:lipopolysaccharide export system permease protein